MQFPSSPSFTVRVLRRWLYAATALALGACGVSSPPASASGSSSAASNASPGATGPTGTTGPGGPSSGKDDGDQGHGDRATLAARAKRGLAISPVPLVLEGRTGEERTMIGLGSYIVNAASDCAGCHSGPAGFLSGGNPFFLGGGQVVWTRNLTPNPETGLALTRDQFFEAIRTGRDFHAGQTKMLVVMPWTTLRWASDLDLDAIYAYLRAIPPVVYLVPPDAKDALPLPPSIPFDATTYTDGVVDRKLKGAGQSFPAHRGYAISPVVLDASRKGVHDDEGRGRSVGVGSYIANAFAHCNDCHTHPDRTADGSKVNTDAFLTGGTVFATPPPLQRLAGTVRATSANLMGESHGFFRETDDSYARFRDILRTGTLVDESPPRPLTFPMNLVASNLDKLLESDLRAVYDWAKAVPGHDRRLRRRAPAAGPVVRDDRRLRQRGVLHRRGMQRRLPCRRPRLRDLPDLRRGSLPGTGRRLALRAHGAVTRGASPGDGWATLVWARSSRAPSPPTG